MQRERDIEKWLCDQIKKLGGHAYKFVSPGCDGVPDRMIILPGGRIHFVELKTNKGKPSQIQKWQMQFLSNLGCDVWLIRGQKEAEDFIHEICTTRVSTPSD